MKVLRCIRVWFWILTIILLFISSIFIIVAFSPGNSAILGRTIAILIGIACLCGGIGLFLWAYKRTKTAMEKSDGFFLSQKTKDRLKAEQQKKENEKLALEFEESQYTYQGSLPLTNHTIIEFSSSDYDTQVWMYSLKETQEIRVYFDNNKDRYLMDFEIPLPPRLVEIYKRKRIVRLYVHKIHELDQKRSIEIMCVYNQD